MKTTTRLNLIVTTVTLLAAASAQAFFDPHVGRFTSRDPIGERGGRNRYGFVRNSPMNHYDLLGLTIPGMCAAAYPNWCPCKCVSVMVTFSPGGDNFQWGWIPNPDGSRRFGNNMQVVWKVKGPSSRCKYHQIESGEFYFYNLSNPTISAKSARWSGGQILATHGTSCWDLREYTDISGARFVSPADDGDWIVTAVTPPSITLECESTDGTKVRQPVTVPSPPNPGTFPPP
jgi:hypothetical protein